MNHGKILKTDYEIGIQRNYELLDFYTSLRNPNDEPETKEYHHSLFYPILCYAIEVINKSNDLNKIKFQVGLDKDNRIYVTVGREMYDYFFLNSTKNLENVEIVFNSGKDEFLLTSVHNKDEADKNKFQKFYDIKPEDIKNKFFKEEELCEQEEKQMKEFIQNKKDVIISKFLKGYSHQESILKAFESKIKGQIQNLPNLIFKKCNKEGKTIEEIDQIYLTHLKSENLTINDFNYFYFVKYINGEEKDKNIVPNGTKFEIVNNNLYFLEIKQSIKGLSLKFENLNKFPLNLKRSSSSKDSYIFKRDELTDLGNAFLSFKIFHDLILYIIGKNENECNLLYIVDSDFEENMIKIFEDCLNRDKIVIEELKLSFNLYLIYTQPDLALRHFIEESLKKKNEIESLFNKLSEKEKENEKKNEEIKRQNKEIEKKNKELEKMKFEMKVEQIQYMDISLDESNIDFIKKKINNENLLVLIGLYENINDNPTYFCDSLNYYHKKNKKQKVTLIDLRTFNKVDLNDSDDSNNELFYQCVVDNYKKNIKKFNLFDEIYLIVDLIFLKNISLFINENILEKNDINIYMMKNDTFIMQSKKYNSLINLITIKNEKCENPLFGESEVLNLFEIEQFANNYMNLLRLRKFIKKTNDKILKEECYLFDFKGRINYILEFCKKADSNSESNKSFFLQITATKDVNNVLIDKYPENYIKDKNIIFVRETEFGKSFEKDELIKILNYNFKIEISEYKNRITWKHDNKSLIIYNNILDENGLTRLIKYKSILPVFLMNDKKVNYKDIKLIEYLYFLFLPLLIPKKSKPKVLIVSDDYGILYNYYKMVYDKELDISFASQNNQDEEIFNKEISIEKKNKIDIISYQDIFKKFNRNFFDLIIIEKCFNDHEFGTIPSFNNKFVNLLTSSGIFSLNIRSSSIYSQNCSINDIKKAFNNIKIINFRICSDFLICSNDKIEINENFCENSLNLFNLDNINFYVGHFIDDVGT